MSKPRKRYTIMAYKTRRGQNIIQIVLIEGINYQAILEERFV